MCASVGGWMNERSVSRFDKLEPYKNIINLLETIKSTNKRVISNAMQCQWVLKMGSLSLVIVGFGTKFHIIHNPINKMLTTIDIYVFYIHFT